MIHPKDKEALERIDAMMFSSDGPEIDHDELAAYITRWERRLKEAHDEEPAVGPGHDDTFVRDENLELLERIGTGNAGNGPVPTIKDERAVPHGQRGVRSRDVRSVGDTDGPRRGQDPNDYDRAQPNKDDVRLVQSFLEGTLAEADKPRYLNSVLSRKLGLLIALQFNRGFDAGVEHVRDENGFSKGYDACLKVARDRINGITAMGERKPARRAPKHARKD